MDLHTPLRMDPMLKILSDDDFLMVRLLFLPVSWTILHRIENLILRDYLIWMVLRWVRLVRLLSFPKDEQQYSEKTLQSIELFSSLVFSSWLKLDSKLIHRPVFL